MMNIAAVPSRPSGWLRWIWRLLAAGLAIVALLLILTFSYYRYRAHQARGLILAMRNLKVGESSLADVQRLVEGNRALLLPPESPCTSDCRLMFRVDTAFWSSVVGHGAWLDYIANRILDWTDHRALGRMGIRNFVVTDTTRVGNDRVTGTGVSVLVEGDCHKWLGGGWSLGPDLPDFSARTNAPKIANSSGNLALQWSHLHMGIETGEVLTAVVTPRATSEEQAAAFGINFDCLTSLSGCFFLGDIMPAAVRLQKSQHWPLGGTSQTCPNHPASD